MPEQEYPSYRIVLLADTLAFDGFGTVTEVSMRRLDTYSAGTSETSRFESVGDYDVRGDSIEFSLRCPIGALCVRPPIGWIEPDGEVVRAYTLTVGVGPRSYFERVN